MNDVLLNSQLAIQKIKRYDYNPENNVMKTTVVLIFNTEKL